MSADQVHIEYVYCVVRQEVESAADGLKSRHKLCAHTAHVICLPSLSNALMHAVLFKTWCPLRITRADLHLLKALNL